MISRHWRGRTKPGHDKAYVEHLMADTFPKLRAIPGFVSASILKRDGPEGTEFEIVTVWQSREAIEGFAGLDIEIAVVPEVAQAMLTDFERRVRHYEIVANATASASTSAELGQVRPTGSQ
jgi:heme-degrading monooxygenase HmoA